MGGRKRKEERGWRRRECVREREEESREGQRERRKGQRGTESIIRPHPVRAGTRAELGRGRISGSRTILSEGSLHEPSSVPSSLFILTHKEMGAKELGLEFTHPGSQQ